jgi:hypothetical protein
MQFLTIFFGLSHCRIEICIRQALWLGQLRIFSAPKVRLLSAIQLHKDFEEPLKTFFLRQKEIL